MGVNEAHMGSNYSIIHHTPQALSGKLHAIFGSMLKKNKIANLERIQRLVIMTKGLENMPLKRV